MAGAPRPAAGQLPKKSMMRPPPRPSAPSRIGRSQSPADSVTSNSMSRPSSPSIQPGGGLKRKERDFDNDGSEETNIHVVVRCRGRSDREVRENSGVVVSTEGVKGKSVELSMGQNALSNKTYHFDNVFSPAADQAIIFDDVVTPILSEMLSGYNCTIFAYGQTGTGKTYTMTGDMSDTLGLLSDAAGIIPRVLQCLFRKLEADETESSMKCSFIELYNEELRDLLSAEDNAKLKIYDDANKKGHNATIVQGMEESHIKSASAGIKLLQEGSFRRQVAATKCNDLSSRSHTVFTITTYIKRTTETGEDFISAGKLNLVDLAGSENIQRSGAENKRAAEAGLINKSLLTLGRVINALVDKSSHIPYRESKLTRLLQDSLGGRTKTCVIATVSPAKSNLEETISTLDYAFRAKNIRNKPQINSMISKKTLLREFTAEIEKLKSELIATRQRNGVYLSNETYEEITGESESRRILSEEQKARIETMEVSLRNKVQELFSLTSSFTNLKKDNEATRMALDQTQDLLEKTEIVLKDTQQNLAEETTLRHAHERTEEQLHGIGSVLISTLEKSVHDVGGLHSKLRRKSDLHTLNRQTWQSSTSHVLDVAQLVDEKLANFQGAQSQMLADLSNTMETFISTEVQNIESSRAFIKEKTRSFEHSQYEVIEQTVKARDDMNDVLEEIKVLRKDVKEKVGKGLNGLSAAAVRISAEVISELEMFHTQLHTSYSSLGRDFKSTFEDIVKHLNAQKAEADELRRQLHTANLAALGANVMASSRLEQTLDEERKTAKTDREDLLAQIKGLIDDSAGKQDARLTSKIDNVKADLSVSRGSLEEADAKYEKGMDEWTRKEKLLVDEFMNSRDNLKSKMKQDWTAVNEHNSTIQETTRSIHGETVRIVDAQMKDMAVQMQALDEFVTRARSQNGRHRETHVETLKGLSSNVRSSYSTIGVHLDSNGERVRAFCRDLKDSTDSLQSELPHLQQYAREPLAELRSNIQQVLMTEYTATGETPQKMQYEYPSSLPRTEPHETLIAKLKQSHESSAASMPQSMAVSPSKSKIYNDAQDEVSSHHHQTSTESSGEVLKPTQQTSGLREIDINVVAKPLSANDSINPTSSSVSSEMLPPPLKRHPTAGESKLPQKLGGKGLGMRAEGRENNPSFSASMGAGGRRLRSSPIG